MAQLAYELSFKGTASQTLAEAFGGSQLTSRHGVTTVRSEVRDQSDLQGLIGRIHSLGLELLEVRLVADADDADRSWIGGL